jgi:hypothetical protein
MESGTNSGTRNNLSPLAALHKILQLLSRSLKILPRHSRNLTLYTRFDLAAGYWIGSENGRGSPERQIGVNRFSHTVQRRSLRAMTVNSIHAGAVGARRGAGVEPGAGGVSKPVAWSRQRRRLK